MLESHLQEEATEAMCMMDSHSVPKCTSIYEACGCLWFSRISQTLSLCA